MKFAKKALRLPSILCAGLMAALPVHSFAQTKAPYLIPYTISTYAGGGTASSVGSACQGQAISGTIADAFGDGCVATSTSVALPGPYGNDIAIDDQGNVYFTDDSSTSKGNVRKIEARSRMIHIFTGNSAKACTGAGTSYGDGCIANDGLANLSTNFTPSFAAAGLAIAKNGDVYIAGGSNNVVHKVSAATGLMTVVAGYISGNTGQGGYTGDGGLATLAELGTVQGVGLDSAGNLYIADSTNNVIRKVTAATGIISTVVGINPHNGNGASGAYTGDGGPATSATIAQPWDVKVDGNGNIFVVDEGNHCVRVVYEGGTQVANLIAANNNSITAAQVIAGNIYTIIGGTNLAGVASSSTSASGKLGTVYKLSNPRTLSLDAQGNVYIIDSGVLVALFLDGATGYIRTIAGIRNEATSVSGSGCASSSQALLGDGCQGIQATIAPGSKPVGITTDLSGNVYIEDAGNGRIRKISTNQVFPAVQAGSSAAQTLLVHLAPGDTPAASSPFTISKNPAGNADFALTTSTCTKNTYDSTQDCVLVITFTPSRPGTSTAILTAKTTLGQTSTFTLSGTGILPSIALDPGTVAVVSSALNNPNSLSQDGAGNIYVADTGNNRVVRFSTAGALTLVAGNGTPGYTGDNASALLATLSSPKAASVGPDGAVYIADTGNNAIRRVDPFSGFITTVAGGALSGTCTTALDTYNNGCPGNQVALSAPAGVAVDNTGNVYISDTGNSLVRELVPTGYLLPVAGGASVSCGADPFGNGCPPAQTILNAPTGLSFDSQNNLYIADTGNHEIRELVSATNLLIDVAGDGQGGAYGDTGTATGAQLNKPTGVSVDAAGNVYIADTGNHAIRLVNATGDINTVAGTLGVQGTGTIGSASSVLLNSPAAIAVSGNGSAYILDSANNRLLSLARTTSTYSFGSLNPGDSSPTVRLQETNTGSTAVTLPSPVFASTAVFSITPYGFDGCTAGQNLTVGGSCYLSAQFNPGALGFTQSTVTETASATSLPSATAPTLSLTLSGTGANLTRTTSSSTLTNPIGGNPPYGTSFTVTTIITPAACSPNPINCTISGTVTYYVDGVAIGLPAPVSSTTTAGLAKGTAQSTISGQSQGVQSIVAVYSGDANYQSDTAPALTVTVAGAVTTTTLVPTPTSLFQFQQLTLTATVGSPIVATYPTGPVNFYAGTTPLGTINLHNGVATLLDTTPSTTLGLYAGTYNITAVYAGDQNFSGSTSNIGVVTVNPDPAAISLLWSTDSGGNSPVSGTTTSIGTSQGSTAFTSIVVSASNTVNDTLSFSCSNLPQYSVCTFTPNNLTFTPVPGAQVSQASQVTLWTDVIPGVIPQASLAVPHGSTLLATLFGWPLLLSSLAGFTLRKRIAGTRLFSVLALCGLMAAGSLIISGCGSGDKSTIYLTPTGTYTVTVTVSGPHTPAQSLPIQFTVTPGLPGQE